MFFTKPSLTQQFNIPLLRSFDLTRLRKELLKKTETFGIWTTFVMKRCSWFLLWPISNLFLTIMVFLWLMAVTYFQFYEVVPIACWILISFYSLFALQWIWITARKILSAVMYDFTIYFVFSSQYDDAHPNPELQFILEEEQKLASFVNHSLISFFWQAIVSASALVVAYFYYHNAWELDVWLSMGQVVLNACLIYLMYRVFRRIIDFEMDFSIITPEAITTFSQAGLTNAQDKTLKHNQIKSITREQVWWIKTFFNFGEIHIKGVGDDTNARASIILNHVRNADRVRDMISQVQRWSVMFEDLHTTPEERKEFGYGLVKTFYKNKVPKYVNDFFNL